MRLQTLSQRVRLHLDLVRRELEERLDVIARTAADVITAQTAAEVAGAAAHRVTAVLPLPTAAAAAATVRVVGAHTNINDVMRGQITQYVRVIYTYGWLVMTHSVHKMVLPTAFKHTLHNMRET